MPVRVVIVVPVMPIRAGIICVTRMVAVIRAVVRSIVRPVVGWITKSKSYMHSSLGLTWLPSDQTKCDER